MSKTTEQLARESGFYNGEIGDLQSELEAFRRLVIEDYIAGLEPVALQNIYLPNSISLYENIDPVWRDAGDMRPLYSLEGMKP